MRSLRGQRREEVVAGRRMSADYDLRQARAIMARTYPEPEPPICAFAVGAAGETCRRCGATWLEHQGPEGGKVTVALHDAPASVRRPRSR
jgi:hypothetical protein